LAWFFATICAACVMDCLSAAVAEERRLMDGCYVKGEREGREGGEAAIDRMEAGRRTQGLL